MILLIDDVKEGGWADIIARNANAGCFILSHLKEHISELHIDFDLSDKSEGGLYVLEHALENECLPDKIFIVSWNPPGREAMKKFLLDNGYKPIIDSRFEKSDIFQP